jgi:membrane fusion protein, multidrug efflux system
MKGRKSLQVALLLVSACSNNKDGQELDYEPLRSEVPAIEVQTATARWAPFEYRINSSGKLQSKIDIDVQTRTGGIVDNVLVKNGAFVKRGEVLAVLTNRSQTVAVEKAQVQLQERQIAYQDALLGYSSSDSSRLSQAMKNIRISSGLAAAEIAFKEASQSLEDTFIKAYVDGVISDLSIKTGGVVAASQIVCRIHSPYQLSVITELLEADALQVKPGMTAEIRSLASNEVIATTVAEVNPRVDEKTNLVGVTLHVNNGNTYPLIPGMTVQVTIKVPHHSVIVVPREALVVRNGRQVVFTAENGLAKWNYVTVGRENGKEVEILEGLTEGKQVIVSNNLQLAHDAVIKITD